MTHEEALAFSREEQLTKGLHLYLSFDVEEFQHDLDDERFTDEQVKNAAIEVLIGEEGDFVREAYPEILNQIRDLLERRTEK